VYTDPRGGYNRKSINQDFFKTWTPQMAYVLGFIFADGTIEDVRKSSRTCYTQLSNNDKSLLIDIKNVLSSNHIIYKRKSRWIIFFGKKYLSSKSYHLRIGSKSIYNDLKNLGLTPRKSLIMKLPIIPNNLFHYFLRGYFDGDGCINLYNRRYKNNDNKHKELKTILTSGSYMFLTQLSKKLHLLLGIPRNTVFRNSGAYRLSFRIRSSLKILSYMYKNLKKAPYLKRKYCIYLNYVKTSNVSV